MKSDDDMQDDGEERFSTLKFSFDVPTLMVVTGASFGFGRVLAFEFGTRCTKAKSILVVTARDVVALKSLAQEIEAKNDGSCRVIVIQYDLSCISEESLNTFFHTLLFEVNTRDYEQALMIHNAGTLGRIETPCSQFSLADVEDFYATNLTSCIAFNNKFLSLFKGVVPALFIVNVSSLLAYDAVKSLSLYCSVKAARNMFFKVLALESSHSNDLSVLSYGPGPMNTKMFDTIVRSSHNSEVQSLFHDIQLNDRFVDMRWSCLKLIHLLTTGSYVSGNFVDYLDVINP